MSGDNKEVAERKPGRPPGAKNKTTLVREALQNGFEEELEKGFLDVARAVIQQAKNGCRQSQKMLLDRVVPTVHSKSEEDENSFAGGVQIFIGTLGDTGSAVEVHGSTTVIEDAQYTEVDQPKEET